MEEKLLFYVMPLPGAYDPNSATHLDMWVVYCWERASSIPRQVAYCSTQHYALMIAALLTATVTDQISEEETNADVDNYTRATGRWENDLGAGASQG